jgi:hypothetical protein
MLLPGIDPMPTVVLRPEHILDLPERQLTLGGPHHAPKLAKASQSDRFLAKKTHRRGRFMQLW